MFGVSRPVTVHSRSRGSSNNIRDPWSRTWSPTYRKSSTSSIACLTGGHWPTRSRESEEPVVCSTRRDSYSPYLGLTSEDPCLGKGKTRWIFHSRNLRRFQIQKKTKLSKQQHGSTSCHIPSSPLMLPPTTRTIVRNRRNLDPAHRHSIHDPGLNLTRVWGSRFLVPIP